MAALCGIWFMWDLGQAEGPRPPHRLSEVEAKREENRRKRWWLWKIVVWEDLVENWSYAWKWKREGQRGCGTLTIMRQNIFFSFLQQKNDSPISVCITSSIWKHVDTNVKVYLNVKSICFLSNVTSELNVQNQTALDKDRVKRVWDLREKLSTAVLDRPTRTWQFLNMNVMM